VVRAGVRGGLPGLVGLRLLAGRLAVRSGRVDLVRGGAQALVGPSQRASQWIVSDLVDESEIWFLGDAYTDVQRRFLACCVPERKP
jgi:hypothetical protein